MPDVCDEAPHVASLDPIDPEHEAFVPNCAVVVQADQNVYLLLVA